MWLRGSFPISCAVIVFEGNSYVFGKNEDIRLFYDFAHGKECD